jgi:hypothetical protein
MAQAMEPSREIESQRAGSRVFIPAADGMLPCDHPPADERRVHSERLAHRLETEGVAAGFVTDDPSLGVDIKQALARASRQHAFAENVDSVGQQRGHQPLLAAKVADGGVKKLGRKDLIDDRSRSRRQFARCFEAGFHFGPLASVPSIPDARARLPACSLKVRTQAGGRKFPERCALRRRATGMALDAGFSARDAHYPAKSGTWGGSGTRMPERAPCEQREYVQANRFASIPSAEGAGSWGFLESRCMSEAYLCHSRARHRDSSRGSQILRRCLRTGARE